ncbi:hypothetical protein BH10PSE2_BH10PSE2_10680 [soil metagenome]
MTRMNRLPLLAACALVLALTTACDDSGVRISTGAARHGHGVLKVITALQCPDTMGSLTRKGSAQADGTVCTYTGPRGAEVSLHLVTLGEDTPDSVLKSFEDRLLADMPATAAHMTQATIAQQAESARADAGQARADAAAARAEASGARAQAGSARAQADSARSEADAARDSARSAADASADGDRAHIRAPGMAIDADGDRASVRLPGIHVEANGDNADVRIGGFTIHANDSDSASNTPPPPPANPSLHGNLSVGDGQDVSVNVRDGGAEVRSRSPGDAVRATYLLTDDTPSESGWRTVGYEARGPRAGPIVVATVRTRERHGDGVFDDAKALVSLNVGE